MVEAIDRLGFDITGTQGDGVAALCVTGLGSDKPVPDVPAAAWGPGALTNAWPVRRFTKRPLLCWVRL